MSCWRICAGRGSSQACVARWRYSSGFPMLRDPSLIPLSQQHHNGLALCVLTRRSLAADVTPENIAKLARRVLGRYELELISHFEIEEQVLFPACGPMPPIALLVAEHRAIETLIAQLRTAPT